MDLVIKARKWDLIQLNAIFVSEKLHSFENSNNVVTV